MKKHRRLNIESFRFSVISNYLLLVILPFLILLSVFLVYTRWNAANTFVDNGLKLIQAEQRQLTGISKASIQNSMFPYYWDFLDGLPSSFRAQETKERIRHVLRQEISIRQNIDAIALKVGDEWITAGRNYDGMTGRLSGYDDVLEENGGRPIWLTAFAALPKNRSGYKLVLGRSLNSSTRMDVAKLYLLIDTDVFEPIFDTAFPQGGGAWLVNSDGVILSASSPDAIGEKMDLQELGLSGKEGWRITQIEGVSCLVVYARSYRTGWTLVRATPVSVVMRGLEVVHWAAFGVGIVYVIFLWLMLARLNRVILKPTEQLAAHMDDFAAGHLSVRADDNSRGEIGKLNRHFNLMTGRITTLMQKNEEAEREKNNFKMAALVAQLNPHFLYNALNTIKWMAAINRQVNIQEITESLIRILMNAAHSEPDYYRLSDEIKLIQDYAVIQKARFMNFTLTCDITEGAAACRIRRFLVQPVVENAIIHGFGRGYQSNGVVSVRAWTDTELHIHVEDNGCGFNVNERLTQPSQTGNAHEHVSLALENIRQIIDMEYGAPYGIRIKSSPGEGTEVDYVLPGPEKTDGQRGEGDEHDQGHIG